MADDDTQDTLFPSAEGLMQSMANFQAVMGKSLVLGYLCQWEMLSEWQRSLGLTQREWMDDWTCRLGGVSLDG